MQNLRVWLNQPYSKEEEDKDGHDDCLYEIQKTNHESLLLFIPFLAVTLYSLACRDYEYAPLVQVEDECAESEHDLELIDGEAEIYTFVRIQIEFVPPLIVVHLGCRNKHHDVISKKT